MTRFGLDIALGMALIVAGVCCGLLSISAVVLGDAVAWGTGSAVLVAVGWVLTAREVSS